MEPMKSMQPMKSMEPIQPMSFGDPWWPKDLGDPSSTGSQNGMRYAFFPDIRRLLVDRDGQQMTYDSGDHRINGVSQQNTQSLGFRDQSGTVSLDDLTVVH